MTMQPLQPTVSDRDNWSGHWSVYAESAGENPAQQMRHKLSLNQIRSVGSEVALLLDIGSGQGDFLAMVAQSGGVRRCVGFELSEVGVSISRAKVPTATFHRSICSRLQLRFRTWRMKLTLWCAPRSSSMSMTGRLLPPYPGQLLVTVPAGPMSADHFIGHRSHYDRTSIARVLDAAGFKVEAVKLAGFPFFNLYRLVIILLGKRLISNVKSGGERSRAGTWASLAIALFRILFQFNLANFSLGC